MASTLEKKDMILKHEAMLANKIAVDVIDKPKLNIWMIIIPIIFVYYFYHLQKFAVGKKEFVKNIMNVRQQILDEAQAAVQDHRKPAISRLIEISNVPKNTEVQYSQWVKVILDHYLDLLLTCGDSYESLVKERYKERNRYLLFLNSLNKAEKRFNQALKSHLKKTIDGADDIVRAMERASEKFQRLEADAIFF